MGLVPQTISRVDNKAEIATIDGFYVLILWKWKNDINIIY